MKLHLWLVGMLILAVAARTLCAQTKNSSREISQEAAAELLVKRVAPIYPPLARNARIQGPVVLSVTISKTGFVLDVKSLSGHPLLIPAAIDAVQQWKYKTYMLGSQPIEMKTTVTINFTLSGDSPPTQAPSQGQALPAGSGSDSGTSHKDELSSVGPQASATIAQDQQPPPKQHCSYEKLKAIPRPNNECDSGYSVLQDKKTFCTFGPIDYKMLDGHKGRITKMEGKVCKLDAPLGNVNDSMIWVTEIEGINARSQDFQKYEAQHHQDDGPTHAFDAPDIPPSVTSESDARHIGTGHTSGPGDATECVSFSRSAPYRQQQWRFESIFLKNTCSRSIFADVCVVKSATEPAPNNSKVNCSTQFVYGSGQATITASAEVTVVVKAEYGESVTGASTYTPCDDNLSACKEFTNIPIVPTYR